MATSRDSTSPLWGDLRAIGVLRTNADNTALVTAEGGTIPLPAGGFAGQEAVQYATPTTGQTVQAVNDSQDRTLVLTPAGTLATLTVTLPSEASSRVGQALRIFTSANLTALTVNGATTLYNMPTSLAVGDLISLRKVGANMWARLQ
jgi:peptidoglycan hydrolase-like protein with peptidoglycan-binding domain